MKRHIFSPGRNLATLLAVAVGGTLLVSLVNAQPAAGPAGGGGGGAGGGGGRGGNRANFQGRGNFLNLDDQQRQLFREAMDKDREAMAKLNDKLQVAQKELMQATLAEKFDDKVVAQKADAVSKIQSELMVIRARAFSAVAPTLKPDQRQELENSRMGAMLLGGDMMMFGGGQRGGGMGGPGGGMGGAGFGGGGGRGQRGGGGGGGGAPAAPAGPVSQPPAR